MFITFEGIEGSGKSTQIQFLTALLEEKGHDVLVTREPGGSELGQQFRSILLDAKNTHIAPACELFLYLADRAQHMGEIVGPALKAGKTVICDRFADSTIVYQGYGRGLDVHLLRTLNDTAVEGLWPDLTLLLDLAPENGLRRAVARNLRDGMDNSEGRFEAESIEFHTRVREGYLTWAALNQERMCIVDAEGNEETVFNNVRCAVESRISR
ncbi:dTMP kinase [Desulfovibrio inopinatus]|uniref:dTMP kinase n=1 Tax=Desulfovibrio inopinatus TaxID=102109 RepID=UPI00041D6B67|nr:dTMP kinase [Desulfovibrio inopinatus]